MSDESEVFEFYRLFGVFDHGGTQADGMMLERHQVGEKIQSWLDKALKTGDDFRSISLVRVTKTYPMTGEQP